MRPSGDGGVTILSRSPVDLYEARATLEMILAVYAAHLAGGRVAFPLKDRKHPLGSL